MSDSLKIVAYSFRLERGNEFLDLAFNVHIPFDHPPFEATLGQIFKQSDQDPNHQECYFLGQSRHHRDERIPLISILVSRCMTHLHPALDALSRCLPKHLVPASTLSDVHRICSRDYVIATSPSSSSHYQPNLLHERAAFFMFHKWRCIDLELKYQTWHHLLDGHWRAYQKLRAPSSLSSHTTDDVRGGFLMEDLVEFNQGLRRFAKGEPPQNLIHHFVYDLMPYLRDVATDLDAYLSTWNASSREQLKWIQVQPLTFTAADHLLQQHLHDGVGGQTKPDVEPRLLMGVREPEYAFRGIELWDDFGKRPMCLEFKSRRMWRRVMFHSVVCNLLVSGPECSSAVLFYWFAPHVCHDEELYWHDWRLCMTRQLHVDDDAVQARSIVSLRLMKQVFEKHGLQPALLPLYELLLNYDRIDWSKANPMVVDRVGSDLAKLIELPLELLTALPVVLPLQPVSQTAILPPELEPDIVAQHPRWISPQAPITPAPIPVSVAWFELLMALEYRARRKPGVEYPSIAFTYDVYKQGIDAPICFHKQKGRWIGLYSDDILPIPLLIGDSFKMSYRLAMFLSSSSSSSSSSSAAAAAATSASSSSS
jgi:hypothetical protein